VTPKSKLANGLGNGHERPAADASAGPDGTVPSVLTVREGEVAEMIARGLSNRRIADALALSERTVEWHVGNVLRKLHMQSRVQVALWAIGGDVRN
jgi:DNA-binding NarL/FixJ family response regulator